MSTPITVNLITGLPQKPYRNGVGQYEGVVAHATATYNDSDEGERNYEASGAWQNAFVHFFVDHDSITQVADTNYIGWGAGPVANPRFVHVELCQTYDQTKFNQAYVKYVWLISKLLRARGLGVSFKGSLWGHKEVSNILGGTTHTDPWDYLASHGKSQQQFIDDVSWWYVNGLDSEIGAKPQQATQPVVSGDTYMVADSDTLWGISKKTGVSVDQLKVMNGITSDLIHPGDKLKLKSSPVSQPVSQQTTPQPVAVGGIKILADVLNIRSGAGKNFPVMGQVTAGKQFNVYDYKNDWYKIWDNQWVFGNGETYVELTWRNDGKPVKSQITPQPVYHTIVPGDTVSALASQFGSTKEQIKAWNGLDGNYTIYAGKSIRVK